MLSRLMIYLSDRELKALQQVAESELRGIREQARLTIRQKLQDDGLLPTKDAQAERTAQAATQ